MAGCDHDALAARAGLRSFSMHPAQILAGQAEVLRADTRKRPWARHLIEADPDWQHRRSLNPIAIKNNSCNGASGWGILNDQDGARSIPSTAAPSWPWTTPGWR